MTMNQQNEPQEWGKIIATLVGERVRKYRSELNLSAQNLSNRTAALGFEVKRSVIAEMENGKRSTVSLADVFILARALAVPPIALIVPLESDDMRLLPNELLDVWKSFDWITGRKNLSAVPAHLFDIDSNEEEVRHWRNVSQPIRLRFDLDRYASAYRQNLNAASLFASQAGSAPDENLKIAFQRKVDDQIEASQINRQGLAEVIGELQELGIHISREYTELLGESKDGTS